MEPPSRASAMVVKERRQSEKAAGRAAERGPRGVQASCQIEMERPSPGTALTMERYRGRSDRKLLQVGVAFSGRT
jgi:hypothetical protein